MQLLKALVIGMAVLLVAGFALVAYVITQRLSGSREPASFQEQALPVPPGCAVAELVSVGRRLALRLEGAAERGCDQILLIDAESGALVGRVRLVPES